MIEEKVRLCKRIEEKEEAYSDISRKIWEYAELISRIPISKTAAEYPGSRRVSGGDRTGGNSNSF